MVHNSDRNLTSPCKVKYFKIISNIFLTFGTYTTYFFTGVSLDSLLCNVSKIKGKPNPCAFMEVKNALLTILLMITYVQE